ncbi:MAG: hypothetical protein WCK00_10225 [Deltaproteobacteria bacterium]
MPAMRKKSKLLIDVTENFRRLAQAPIVEAVIEIRARAESSWAESVVLEQLKANLPDYLYVLRTGGLKFSGLY